MALARRPVEMLHGYTVEEVSRFLQYDEQAIRYWLRTGHLEGRRDAQLGDWRITPSDLVAFLRGSSEPMPTGVVFPSQSQLTFAADPEPAASATASSPDSWREREPLLVGSGIG